MQSRSSLGSQESSQATPNLVRVFQSALPDGENMPAPLAQLTVFSKVTSLVVDCFLIPEGGITRRTSGESTICMGVPKAAVYEDRSLPGIDDEIWSTWQRFNIASERNVKRPKKRSHGFFGSRTRLFDL